MNDKVYVDVFMPVMNKSYNFVLPVNMTAGSAVALMAKIISKKEQIQLLERGLMLYDMKEKLLINAGKTALSGSITDGARLMLV